MCSCILDAQRCPDLKRICEVGTDRERVSDQVGRDSWELTFRLALRNLITSVCSAFSGRLESLCRVKENDRATSRDLQLGAGSAWVAGKRNDPSSNYGLMLVLWELYDLGTPITFPF